MIEDESKIEQYLLASDREAYIKTLVAGSKEAEYFTLLNLLNSQQVLTGSDEKKLEKFSKDHGTKRGDTYNTILDFRQLLQKFDANLGNEKQQTEVLKQIKERFCNHISFNYNKPSNIGQTAVQNKADNQNIKSEVDNSIFNFEKFTNNSYKKINDYRRINHFALSRTDPTKLQGNGREILQAYQSILDQADISNWGDKGVDLCVKYIEKYKSEHKSDHFDVNRVQLTLNQLEKLGQKVGWLQKDYNYNKVYFLKNFQKRLNQFQDKKISDLTKEQKNTLRVLAQDIALWSKKKLHASQYSLYDQMQYIVLLIDADLEQYSKELFLQFLENPLNYGDSNIGYSEQNYKKLSKIEKYQETAWHQSHQLDINYYRDYDLVKEYLKFFFESADNYDEFLKYFNTGFLKNLFNEVKLLQGKTVEKVDNYLLESLTKQKYITIIKSNQKFFKAGEEIKLYVDIKNIQNMTIKVFEINTENYYIKNKSSFDNSLNLEGINPLDQQANIKFSENPIVKKRHEFKFEKLAAVKRGVFIIEFIGNGITSRAVIRKGGLQHLEKQTLAGHQLTLVTEDQKVCIPDENNRTGVWLNDRFIKANQKGQVVIPYGSSQQSYPMIIVHNDFAELTDLVVKTENYKFSVAYLYHEETFLRGNKAKIILQPRLYINGIPCSMKLIEDAQVSAILVNEQDIPNTYNFKNLKLTHTEDIEIEVPVQNMIRSLQIDFSGKIKKLNGEFQKLNDQHHIQFDLYDNSNQICYLYLQNQLDKGYVLSVLGKNGEPKPNMIVDIGLHHSLIQQKFSSVNRTDDKGQIILGKLVDITQVEASMRASINIEQTKRQWFIRSQNKIQYPSIVNITKNDVFTIPAHSSEVNQHQYSLYEVVGGQIIANHTNKLQYNKNTITVPEFQTGEYILEIKELGKKISIRVIDGIYWEHNDNYMIESETNCFIERTSNTDQNMKILNCQAEGEDKLKIELLLPENVDVDENALKMVRLHVFGFNFNQNDCDQQSNKLRQIQEAQSTLENQFGMKKSVFLNNKQLGDEICYVFDRQNQKKYIGNTLEKPNILLKRTFVRDTNFDKEDLAQDVAYNQGLEERFQDEKAVRRNRQEVQHHYGSAGGRAVSGYKKDLDSLLNFLENPCYVKSNVKVNKNGECIIEGFPVNKYTQVHIVATNLSASVNDTFQINKQEKISLRDMRLKSNLSKDIPSLEKRGSVVLQNGSKVVIQAGSESVIIDNIAQFFEIQKEIIITGAKSDTQNGGYKFWEFLANWNTLSEQEKLKKYDEFACHEINLFLYMKDREFFEKVVYVFLQNKLEKSFMDYFLLGDKQKLIYYGKPQNVSKINYMEKCLLLSFLMQNGQEKEAISLQKTIELEGQGKNQDTIMRKRLFDTVISAKSKAPEQQHVMRQVQNQMQQQQKQMQQSPQMYQKMSYAAPPQMAMRSMNIQQDTMMNMAMQNETLECVQLQSANTMITSKKKMFSKAAEQFNDFEFEEQVQQRKEYKPAYQKLKKTKEYVERTYYDLKNTNQQSTHIVRNEFWNQYAKYIVENQGNLHGFIHESFIYAYHNHSEMISCLAVISLDFEGGKYQMQPSEGRGIEISSNEGLIIFLKDIVQGIEDLKQDISINQRIFDPKDRYQVLEDDPGVQVEKNIDEYIVDKIYGCQTIITNCSIAGLEFQILREIPEGSIPVKSVDYTKSHTMRIESYQTQKIEYFFYFPSIGTYKSYPANVSRNDKVLAQANDLGDIVVKQELTVKKLESFMDIIRNGSQEDILQFISEKNIKNTQIFKFQDIYWLLKEDTKFFMKFTEILRNRNIFDLTTWTFSILHCCPREFIELLESREFQQRYMQQGSQIYLRSFTSQSFNIQNNELFEYHPLLSSRAHNFMNENKSKILNKEFKQTYSQFLKYLIEKRELEISDILTWSYYLLLQERVEESIKVFQKVKDIQRTEGDNIGQIQQDYMSAYLDIYNGLENNFQVARDVAKKYQNYPVISWQNLFKDLQNQLKEYDGELVGEEEQVKDSEMNKNLKVGDTEENISIELDNKDLVINYQNIKEVIINYYEIDLEVLFSRTPFINKERDEFAFVKANHTEIIKKENSSTLLETMRVKIPDQLTGKNLFIQVKSSNQVQTTMYFSNNLKVTVIENYGQVKIMDEKNAPLSKVYVKCFSRDKQGQEQFYRDGYTDLRGRFDYALSSSSDINQIEKFSILVCSEQYGSIIKEAKVPSQLGTMQKTVNLY